MTESIVYLVTGVNRGIGQGLVKTLLLRSNTLVIGTVRDLGSPDIIALKELGLGNGSELQLIRMDISEPDDILKTISNLDVDKIEVVLSNAAISRAAKSVAEVPLSELLDHFKVNTIGSLALYQASRHLLESCSNPKFIFFTSAAGSIPTQAEFPFNSTPYSVSKTAVNAIGARLAFEEKGKLIVILLHPGVVLTRMVQDFKLQGQLEGMALHDVLMKLNITMLSVEECVQNIFNIVDNAKHEDSGKFIDATNGEILPRRKSQAPLSTLPSYLHFAVCSPCCPIE